MKIQYGVRNMMNMKKAKIVHGTLALWGIAVVSLLIVGLN